MSIAFHRYKPTSIALLVVGIVLISLGFVAVKPPAHVHAAEPIVVNSFGDEKADDGLCTLREAVIAANRDRAEGSCSAGSGADTILVPPGVYTITRLNSGNEDAATTGDLDLREDVTIRPSEPGLVVIDGGADDARVFEIRSGHAKFYDLTIRNGRDARGAGIYVNEHAEVSLVNVTLTANFASQQGGALYLEDHAQASLTNVTIVGNDAPTGAAIRNNGSVTAVESLIGPNGDIAVPACSGSSLQGDGPNIAADSSCATANTTIATELGLTALTDGVGVTFWRLTKTSPAIDAVAPGNGNACRTATDQLGTPRPQRNACDIGAHELPQLPPVASPATTTTAEDTSVTVTLSGADPENDPLTFAVDQPPASGSLGPLTQVTTRTATAVYTPAPNFNGTVTFSYYASDGVSLSSPATVTITVSSVNDSPVAANDTLTTEEDTPATVAVISNDSDVDNNLDPTSVKITRASTNGTATPDAAGSVTFAPKANWYGTTSFDYEVCDLDRKCATASVAVTVESVEDAPLAADDVLTVVEDIAGTLSLVGNDVDYDSNLDPSTAVLITPPDHGTAVVKPDGTATYTPGPKNWWGTTSFEYQVCDTTNLCDRATVAVTVKPDAFLEAMSAADSGPGSLRDMITQANADPTTGAVVFELPGPGPHVIYLDAALPPIQYPVVIDGTTQPNGEIILDGQGRDFPAFVLLGTAGGSTIKGITLRNFGGSGIVLQQSGGNTIVDNHIIDNGGDGVSIIGDPNNPSGTGGNKLSGNVITGNGGNGVTITDSVQNDIVDNVISGNNGLSVDLGGDGRTPNDPLDADTGANLVQNYPVIFRAQPEGDETANAAAGTELTAIVQLDGWLNSVPNATFTIRAYVGDSCNAGEQRLIQTSPATVTTGSDGSVYFSLLTTEPLGLNQVVSVTATDADGNTSEYSDCILVSYDNDSWPRALPLNVKGNSAVVHQYLDIFGQARWYRFSIQPHTQVEVLLTNLPDNYDLTIYKDLADAYEDLLQPQDLNELSAEFAPSAFSPSAFSPSAFSPSAFSPSAFSPSAFSPSAFSPSAFSPSAFSPSAFSPSAFSPSAFSPSAFSPSAFSPSAFSPSAFSPSAFSPSAFSPSAFSSAQTRSLIGVSAFDGTAGEGLSINTWNNTGNFYIRVRGREGAFSLDAPFRLQVSVTPGPCVDLPADNTLPATSLMGSAGDFRSIILVDEARLRARYAAADVDTLLRQLNTLAGRPEVKGVIVNVNADARVAAANARADTYTACPYAKNLVAESIRSVIQAYDAVNPLEYVVLVGNDDVIPFFRYPDNALLGHESNYVPPVRDNTASQASLRLGYVLSQDAYGAAVDLSLNATEFPVPRLAVGRLVESPGDILTLLEAYLGTPDGVAPVPQDGFVTGYDFLEDAALAVQNELAVGLNTPVDSLITPQEVSPLDPSSWTAKQLKDALATQRYDVVFLAGHFNASSALAADYRTSFLSTDLLGLPVDMKNALYFSAGCHSGYNIVTPHGVSGVTYEPDWAQAFAQRGATLVAGTGYQYGDTQFLEYSERLYLEFARKLRTGDGPVPVGKALVAAKQRYLATTPFLRGIHEKAVLQATLFGLPMFAVNMPGARLPADSDASVVTQTQPVGSVPGSALGLQTADLSITPQLAERVLELKSVDDGATYEARWLAGSDGVVTNPAEPTLPLESMNVAVPGMVLRGVGLRGGTYQDLADILPLTGAPTTELRGIHSPFQSDVWFPLRPWGVNYFGALTGDGTTRFNVTPAQHKSTTTGSLTSFRRQFSRMDFRLYYTPNVGAVSVAADGQGGVADTPTIIQTLGFRDGDELVFHVRVVGNPAAGMQNVWVTYTAVQGPWFGQWQSIDLTQSPNDSTLWVGRLPLGGTTAGAVRFIAQAVNGAGLVTLADNLGRYYTPDGVGSRIVTTIEMEPMSITSAAFGDVATFAATLRDINGNPLVNLPIVFGVGPQNRLAVTDANGRAQASIPMLAMPGEYLVNVAFAGNDDYAASAVTSANFLTIRRQGSILTLEPLNAEGGLDETELITATLIDAAGRRLVEQTVFFVVTSGGTSFTQPVITNLVGAATLGGVPLPAGRYSVLVRYDGATSHEPALSQTGQLRLDAPSPTDEEPNNQPGPVLLYLPLAETP